jgi:hypothetical protein
MHVSQNLLSTRARAPTRRRCREPAHSTSVRTFYTTRTTSVEFHVWGNATTLSIALLAMVKQTTKLEPKKTHDPVGSLLLYLLHCF